MKFFFTRNVIFAISLSVLFSTLLGASLRAEQSTKIADHARKIIPDSCGGPNGPMNGMDMYSCSKKKLKEKEREMDALIKKAVINYSNFEGSGATEENRNRIIASQQAWKKYRDEHCLFGYYERSPIHAPSQDAAIEGCRLSKTEDRIREIQQSYLPPYEHTR